ncbi:hypothetical protein [Terrimonas pollutisoli]|nr:hypothetical protein [Terrimonas sp. H1YJ31]
MKTILLLISFIIAWQFSFCREEKLWLGIEREVRVVIGLMAVTLQQ